MKSSHFLILPLLLFITSCTTYQEFDKDKSYVFELNDSSRIAIGPESWKGPDDCSATAYMNRTETGLLLTIRVKDDSVRTGNEFSYMNDGVEIYMDFRPPRLNKRNAYEKGVFQAVIIPLPGKKNVAPIEWYPKNYSSAVNGAKAWTRLFDSSYVVQVLFPYSSLKRNHFWPRSRFSMDIAINDADSVNRETQIIWKGKADNWNNPANFYEIVVNEGKEASLRERRKKTGNPNMLVILTDQQTMTAMGAYGNPYVQTPNMDALAAAGVRFTQSYCTSPACSPSKSSIITGMFPHQTGVNYNGQKPDSSILNMGEIFRQAGYKTIWGGKWHLPEIFPHTSAIDSLPGFQVVDFASPEKTTGNGNDTDPLLADAVVKQLQRRPDEPWLMVVSFQNPHDINNFASKPDSYLPAVNPESMAPLPLNFETDPLEPKFLKDCRNRNTYENTLFLTQKQNPAEWRDYQYQYHRLIENLDHEIGKLISILEKQGYDENTLIVFTSDHGDGATAHRWAGSLSPYEEVMKVPLIISWFGKEFRPNADSRHLVSGIDILPTMLDYAGIPVPENIAGRSLKPIIENHDTTFREFLYAEIAPDPAYPERLGRMVRYRNYKYVLYSYGSQNEQLFDLKADPGEMENLAYQAKHLEIKDFLNAHLNSWMREKSDYFKFQE
jgi:arylsulfatase A-like enzyme